MVRERLGHGEPALITRERHRLALQGALESLLAIEQGAPVELIAEDLRIAGRKLGSVIGLIDVEDVLGEIFSRFCIGK